MKHIILLLSLFTLSISLIAQEKPLVIDSSNSKDVSFNQHYKDFIANWDYKQLETNNASLLDEIEMFYVRDNHILVKDVHDSFQRLMLFSYDGKFITRIGEPGEDKNQHGLMGFIRIDEKNHQIAIYDGSVKKQFVSYDYNGKYLDNGKCASITDYLRDLIKIGDNKYLGYTACGINDMCYFTTDSLLQKYDTIRQHFALFPMGRVDFSIHPITIYNNKISCLAPLCDTIFEFKGNALAPRFIINCHKSVLKDYDITKEDYLVSINTLRKQHGIYNIDDIFETSKWFILTYRNGKYFIDKKNKSAFFIPTPKELNNSILFPSDIWGSKKNQIVSIFSSEELLNLKQELINNNITPTHKLKELLDKVKENENPWIIYYNLTTE